MEKALAHPQVTFRLSVDGSSDTVLASTDLPQLRGGGARQWHRSRRPAARTPPICRFPGHLGWRAPRARPARPLAPHGVRQPPAHSGIRPRASGGVWLRRGAAWRPSSGGLPVRGDRRPSGRFQRASRQTGSALWQPGSAPSGGRARRTGSGFPVWPALTGGGAATGAAAVAAVRRPEPDTPPPGNADTRPPAGGGRPCDALCERHRDAPRRPPGTGCSSRSGPIPSQPAAVVRNCAACQGSRWCIYRSGTVRSRSRGSSRPARRVPLCRSVLGHVPAGGDRTDPLFHRSARRA